MATTNGTYEKLDCVGRGGSCKVYKVMAPDKKIRALKKIRVDHRDDLTECAPVPLCCLSTPRRNRRLRARARTTLRFPESCPGHPTC